MIILKTISREELKEKQDRKDNFKLVMTLDEQSFKMAHIPGSINISSMEQAEGVISPDDEIVVYCMMKTARPARPPTRCW